MRIKESAENYLETIYMLSKKAKHVRNIDVANELGFSRPSVSRAVGILKDNGFLKVAEDGDVFAQSIIVNEAHNFARTVFALLGEIEKCSVLALYGGVFQHNELFRETFMEDISEIYPDLEMRLLTIPPEDGALKIAREL